MDIDAELLAEYDRKTRKGYPLGEVKQDLLAKGYSDAEAERFLGMLGKRIIDQTKHKEERLIQTAALILAACGIILYASGSKWGKWFVAAGSIWWLADYFLKEKKDRYR